LNAISNKALEASKSARLSRSYWDWEPMIRDNKMGFFPYTPATNLLYGLREALRMLFEEGLQNAFARHRRHAEATRRAARTWGLEILWRSSCPPGIDGNFWFDTSSAEFSLRPRPWPLFYSIVK